MRLKKVFILKILGLLCVALGTLGVFLPILPTTPFLLLAVFFFSKSSPGLSVRLRESRLLGSYISAYYSDGAGLSVVQKVRIIIILWGTILVSVVWFTDLLWVRILLLVVAVGVSIHICLLGRGRRGGKNSD
ncbi:MAG: YbaN family protein [Rikenellaceae bacterium]